ESLARAHQRLGERAYNLQFNNCEHFVTWCIQGVHHSEQVDQAWSTVLLAITLAQTPLQPIRTTVPTFPALLAPLTNKIPTWLMPWRLR
ncbi:lecithin retinol acyltransferase family protein, partial [Aeromonas veronii]